MAVERNPGRDHRDYESQASDAAEDTEGANQWVFGEVLDQVFPQRRLRLWKSFQLVDQNPDADSLQRLPGAVEDDEGDKRDSARTPGRMAGLYQRLGEIDPGLYCPAQRCAHAASRSTVR